jgi:hypothetical protein
MIPGIGQATFMPIKPMILKGSKIRLKPLNESHKNELFDAAQDEMIWIYNGSNAYGESFDHWFEKAILASQLGQHIPFVVRRL